MKIKQILHTLLERKRINAVDIFVLRSRISNWHRRMYSRGGIAVNLDVNSGKDWESRATIDVKIENWPKKWIRGKKVYTKEFERKVLKGTGWKVTTAFAESGDVCIYLEVPKFWGKSEYRSEDDPRPRFLFHAAPTRYERAILRQGLKPRNRPYNKIYRYHEPRVYLYTHLDKSDLHQMMLSIESEERQGGKRRSTENLQYTVFKIDTRKFNKFNLFTDRSDPGTGAAYTLTHIPAKALKVLYRYKKDDPIPEPMDVFGDYNKYIGEPGEEETEEFEVDEVKFIVNALLEQKKTRDIPYEQLKNQIINWIIKRSKNWVAGTLQTKKEYFAKQIKFRKKNEESIVISISQAGILTSIHPRITKRSLTIWFEKEALKGTNWSISTIEGHFLGSGDPINIIIERYKKPITKSRYLYHATSKENAKKIKKQGLKPSKNFDPGGYNYTTPKLFLCKSIKYAINAYINDYGYDNMVIFRLDTKKFNRFNLYKDRTEKNAYYTFTHIPAKALEIISYDPYKWF